MTDPADEGGDPACWSHLLHAESAAVDLTALLADAGDGVHWTLASESDLNANLAHLDPGHSVDEHLNEEVDVLVVVLAGEGHATVDGERIGLARNVVAHLPRGARRSLHASAEGLSYLTIHRRRGPLNIGPRPA